MRNNILATQIVQDFNRRGIAPDCIYEVTQGTLRLWRLNLQLIPELYIGGNPKELIITGKYSYTNTVSPQTIADDLMAESQLKDSDIAILTPSQMGKLGGVAKSEAKAQAARENGRKGGRPRKKSE